MAIIGKHTAKPVNWLTTGLRHARRVGRLDGRHGPHQGPLASGLLVDGGQVLTKWSGVPLFLTAAHAVGDPRHSPIRSLWDLTIVFEGMFDDDSPDVTAEAVNVMAHSPFDYLDFSLLLLDRWPGPVDEVKFAPKPPKQGESVYVISYPVGGGLSVSLQDNDVIPPEQAGAGPGRKSWVELYYTAPTQPGSSGAPVFNEFWEVVAMHVAGFPHGNCGILIDPILKEARSQLSHRPVPYGYRSLSGRAGYKPAATPQERASRSRGSTHKIPGDETPVADHATAAGPAVRTPVEHPPAASNEDPAARPQYQSVFISYSRKDSTFANRLHTALQSRGIRAWLDNVDLKPGTDVNDEISNAIRDRDKVLLCCSRASLEESWWVDRELTRVFDKERYLQKRKGRRSKALVLIPLDLDGHLFEGWKSGKADQVRARAAVDFRGWVDSAQFDLAFAKLLSGLETPVRRRRPKAS